MSAIFKRELRAYFTTPIGYVFCAVFLFIAGIIFFFSNLLARTADLNTLFFGLVVVLALAAPILTMRQFAEEYRQKTDQLLLSAPVRPADIVLGKFFSSLLMIVVALAVTLVFPLIIALYGVNNGALLLGGYIAVLAASMAFCAIGLFVSSLTESPVVAMLGSLGLFAVLGLGNLLSGLAPWAWLRSLVSWVSLFSRFGSFSSGVFPLNDMVFYLSLTALFLFFTVRTVEKKRWA